MRTDSAGLPLLRLSKSDARWRRQGQYVALSAEWEVQDIDGLLVRKRRPKELMRRRDDGRIDRSYTPPPAWKVYAREPKPALVSKGKLILDEVLPASELAQQVAELLRDQRFASRDEALWAIRVELLKLDPALMAA